MKNVRRRTVLFFMAALIALAMGHWVGVEAYVNPPNTLQFELDGCRNNGSLVLPNADGNFVCPDPPPLGGNDTAYTTGNLGKGWNELDLVPHRLITSNGNSGTAVTYNVIIAADYQTAGKTGYDAMTTPEILTNPPDTLNVFSDPSCQMTYSDVGYQSGVTGGADVVIYRILTITQNPRTTCVIDWANRLALGSHMYPGSSLQSYMFEREDFSTGKRTVSIPVKEILPQELSKAMTADQDVDYVWSITKSPHEATLNFGDVCAQDAVLEKQVTISVEWDILPGALGQVTVVTKVTAKNPASRMITVNVTDVISGNVGAGVVPLDEANSGDVDVPANTTILVLTHTFLAPYNVTDLSDVATATYTDKATGLPVPGTTTAIASASVRQNAQDQTTNVTDSESISGTGLTFSVDDVAVNPSYAWNFTNYTMGDFTTGPVNWQALGQTACTNQAGCFVGSVDFTKTVKLDQKRETSGTLSDTAIVAGTTGTTIDSDASSVSILSDAKVKLTITKSIPDPGILTGDEQLTFTFDVCAASGMSGDCTGANISPSPAITFGAGDPASKSVTVGSLEPGYYRVSEELVKGFTPAANPQYANINLPTCSAGLTFDNSTPPGEFAKARVRKATVPAGFECLGGGWYFTLASTTAGCEMSETVQACSDYVAFAASLVNGCHYTITETEKQFWQSDGGSSECSFTVDYPTDFERTFSCTYTNTRLGQDLTVTKTAAPSFTRTFHWTIDKSADKPVVYSAGGGASEAVNFTVKVAKDAGTDGNWAVSGMITVHNSNDFAVDGVSLSDAAPGGNCIVTPASVNLTAGGDATASYTCTFASAPVSGTNTVTATWPDINSPSTSGTGTAPYTFGAPTSTVNNEIDVTDTNGGSWHFMDSSSVSYQMTYTDPAGTCTEHVNTSTITQTGASASATVKDCQGADLTVTKTAAGTFNRVYHWLIDKSVDSTQVNIASGGTATFNYDVKVTPNGYTDGDWALGGTITVNNPNDWQDVMVNLADVFGGGGTCTVVGGNNVVVGAGKSVTLDYSCTFDSQPSYAGMNTATATWDKAVYHTPDGMASGSADVTIGLKGETDKSITVVDDKTDPANPVVLGTSDYYSGPFEFTYSLGKQGVAGTCTYYTNTAVIDETKQSDTQTVKVCVGKDLEISKTAAGTFDRLYLWKITKLVDKTSVTIDQGGSYTFNYTVGVEETGLSDSGWKVFGTITITNPNNWEDITLASLVDMVDNGGICTVDAGPYVVPKSGTLGVAYNCTYTSMPSSYSGMNIATATWDKATYFTPVGSAEGMASFSESQSGSTNKTVTVTDSFGGDLGMVTATDVAPFAKGTFTYQRTVSSGDVPPECGKYDNTATITETGQTASQSVGVCVYGNANIVKTVSGAAPAAGQTFTFQIRSGASTSSDGTLLEQKDTDASGNLSFATKLTPGQTYQICEWVFPGWSTNLAGDGALFVPNSIIPPALPNPNVNNLTVCADFTVTSGQTRSFAVDNTPPPGGRALTIGFWKNWASCSSSKGKGQDPMLDLALGYASKETTNPPAGLVVSAQNAGSGWPDYASLWYLVLKGDPTSTEDSIKPAPDCTKAVNILNKSTIDGKKKMASDPLFNMAAQLLAAELNRFMGSGISGATITNIDRAVLLEGKYKFNGLTYSPKLSSVDASLANCLAAQLDNYNNGRTVSSCP